MFRAQGCLGTHLIGVQQSSSSATSMGVRKYSRTCVRQSKVEASSVSNFPIDPAGSGRLKMFLGVRKRPF